MGRWVRRQIIAQQAMRADSHPDGRGSGSLNLLLGTEARTADAVQRECSVGVGQASVFFVDRFYDDRPAVLVGDEHVVSSRVKLKVSAVLTAR